MESTKLWMNLNRPKEARFYHSGKGVSKYHHVEITRDGIHGLVDSHGQMENIDLGKVRERKTKKARAEHQGIEKQQHTAPVSPAECQMSTDHEVQ